MRVVLHVLLEPMGDEGGFPNASNAVNNHARMTVSKPIVEGLQFIVPSVNRACCWRLIGVGGVNADQRG